ncbi:hypothetical protein P2318_34055 [Myxococcaceae bacterium GXIMD 01537]
MQRPPASRPAQLASAESEPETLPAPPPERPLAEWVEEVRGVGVVRADVDGLLAALARGPTGEETPRERADLLIALLGDTRLRDFTGSDGRTVRAAAAQALIDLGYPYALELPPDALPPLDDLSERRPASTGARLALGIMALLGNLLTVGALTVLTAVLGGIPTLLTFIGALVTLGPLLALLGAWKRLEVLQWLGMALMGIEGLGALGLGCLALYEGVYPAAVPLLGMAAFQVWAAWVLREPWPEPSQEP